MKLSPYIENLQKSLKSAAAPAGEEVASAAELLANALESSVRLSLIEAMSDASEEITDALGEQSVEARLRGREIEFVVSDVEHPPMSEPPGAAEPEAAGAGGEVARISLRLPEQLKDSVEKAAAAENISVNSWLVQAIAAAVGSGGGPDTDRFSGPLGGPRRRARFGRRYTGYAKA